MLTLAETLQINQTKRFKIYTNCFNGSIDLPCTGHLILQDESRVDADKHGDRPGWTVAMVLRRLLLLGDVLVS